MTDEDETITDAEREEVELAARFLEEREIEVNPLTVRQMIVSMRTTAAWLKDAGLL